jgi:hypothetical protein
MIRHDKRCRLFLTPDADDPAEGRQRVNPKLNLKFNPSWTIKIKL